MIIIRQENTAYAGSRIILYLYQIKQMKKYNSHMFYIF